MHERLTRIAIVACCCLAVQPPSVARAEIVVLDNGRFLRAEGYEVEGDEVRITLDSGGELILPLLRVERIVEDEIASEESTRELAASAPPPIALGFEPEHQVPDTPYGDAIFRFAKRHNVNPGLVAAVARAESAFDPNAVSNKGARGLMQLTPATGKRLGVYPNELFDAEINLEAGVRYLEELIERYSADLRLVLAAYNAGEGAVDRHNGVPPYRETQEYIRRIYSLLGVSLESADAPGK